MRFTTNISAHSSCFTMGKKRESKASSGVFQRTLLPLFVLVPIVSLIVIHGSNSLTCNSLLNYENDFSYLTPGTSRPKQTASPLKNVLKTTAGEGWAMWDANAPLKMDPDWQCVWTTFRATSGEIAPMCVHQGDAVSGAIIGGGRWGDCDILSDLYNRTTDIQSLTSRPVYLEVGANIGSCMMEMLLSTDVPIVAFEPHPRNQFCLTSTLMALPKEMRDRVSFFPIALGAERGSSVIHAAKGNMGNSVIGTPVKDRDPTTGLFSDQEFYPPIPIQIERLDTILNTGFDDWNIPLMKMDAQGFECNIIDGMGEVLIDYLATVSTELAYDWLVGQGCSDVGMLDRFRAGKFEAYLVGWDKQLSLIEGTPADKGVLDVITMNKRFWKRLKIDAVKQTDSPLKNILKTTSGEGWTMWNGKAPLKMDPDWKCVWTNFRATSGEVARMCVHEGDAVSMSIIGAGRWGDCDILSELYNQTNSIQALTAQPVYLEVGANIGSCMMEMLLSTDVPIVAFEPHPRNQFCLTSTLMALPKEMRDRVSFFPIALGAEKGSSVIHAAKGNMGNSVIGTPVKDRDPTTGFFSDQEFYPPIPIQIERLDTILNTGFDDWNIPLMKMDAQGFECNIIDGMGKVLDVLATVSTELAYDWLIGQGCSDLGMLDRFRAANFDAYLIEGSKNAILIEGAPAVKGVLDVIAQNKRFWKLGTTPGNRQS